MCLRRLSCRRNSERPDRSTSSSTWCKIQTVMSRHCRSCGSCKIGSQACCSIGNERRPLVLQTSTLDMEKTPLSRQSELLPNVFSTTNQQCGSQSAELNMHKGAAGVRLHCPSFTTLRTTWGERRCSASCTNSPGYGENCNLVPGTGERSLGSYASTVNSAARVEALRLLLQAPADNHLLQSPLD